MKLSLPNTMTTENPPATVQVERGRRADSELPVRRLETGAFSAHGHRR